MTNAASSDAEPDVIRCYDDLVAALVKRRHELGWSQLEVDYRANFPDGYTGKLERWRSKGGRTAGSVSLPRWLSTLGMQFVAVASQPRPRPASAVRLNGADLARRIPEDRRPGVDRERRLPADERARQGGGGTHERVFAAAPVSDEPDWSA